MKPMTKRQERKTRKIKYLMFLDTNEIIELNDDGFIKNENQSRKLTIQKPQPQTLQRRPSQLSVSQTLTIDNPLSSTFELTDQDSLNSDENDLCLIYDDAIDIDLMNETYNYNFDNNFINLL